MFLRSARHMAIPGISTNELYRSATLLGDLNIARLIIECPQLARLVVRFLSELLFGRRISVPKRKAKQIPEKKAMIAQLKSMGRCGQRVIDDQRHHDHQSAR